METPRGAKRTKEGTPTPDDERSDGGRLKRGRGEPIPMDTIKEPEVGAIAAKSTMSYADAAMHRAQEEAMKLAPDWAKVIVSILRDNISKLGQTTKDLRSSIDHNDTRLTKIEQDESKVRVNVTQNTTAIDEIKLKFAKLEVEHKKLQERVIRHEAQARKTNILFCGIREDGADT